MKHVPLPRQIGEAVQVGQTRSVPEAALVGATR